MRIKQSSVLDQRRAGILLHPSSLPGDSGNGDFGPQAYHFVEFLNNCGFSVWQVLPLVPTHEDGSPYMGLSVLAGDPNLISVQMLFDWGWLTNAKTAHSSADITTKRSSLIAAAQGFKQHASDAERSELAQFVTKHDNWLQDYALFVALREENVHQSWVQWPAALRDRDPDALKQAQLRLSLQIQQIKFEQFVFFKQWLALKQFANDKGIQLIGDIPIFVAHDSAEVWAHRESFDLLENGQARTIAGVPPDYFSATGQRWGNPHYNWSQMKQDGFQWWVERLRGAMELYDLVRVDHFRGFESYWEINADEETAINGRWVKTPGKALFDTLLKTFTTLPFIAEDLGTITPAVNKLRTQFGWPGMKILQFAFDGQASNPYLPHNYADHNFVVYTGTHDNDTTVNWFNELNPETKSYVEEYLGFPKESMPWPLIRCALASTALLAIIPMQDILAMGNGHRMNTPGKTQGNWQWRFSWDSVSADLPTNLKRMISLYTRNISSTAK